jgi:type II secretory pathway predicted ATPase ExeA
MTTSDSKSGTMIHRLAERNERVFPAYPQVARYFASAALEDARKRLGRAIERGDGPGLVIGAPGTGKSLLLQVLAAQYHARFDVVLLSCARLCTRRALLQAILFELGMPYKLRDEGEVRLTLLDHLLSSECPSGLLLLVDEAHTLPAALLDELRVLTNLVRGDGPRVRLVLAGSSLLEETFATPELESFSQRLAARCYTAPFGRNETTQFVRAQLGAAGASPEEVFAADAWDAVFDATDGVPRLINHLCDRALQLAADEGCSAIDRAVIQRAWSDLQQLPGPWESPSTMPVETCTSSAIEFGSLGSIHCLGAEGAAEDAIDLEPTDLDFDEADTEVGLGTGEPAAAVTTSAHEVRNPFAETFENEEVVLDTFAAWDDLFRHELPRVTNRRDPGFAALVQAAMNTSPAAAPRAEPGPERLALAPKGGDRIENESEWSPDVESHGANPARIAEAANVDSADDSEHDDAPLWPPLRLAIVSEPAPLNPIPLLPPAARPDAVGAAAFESMATAALPPGGRNKLRNEAPVLVIEDDAVPPAKNSPVRREQYRNLFSRLRSG